MIVEESHATYYCATCGCGAFLLSCGIVGFLYFLGCPYYEDEIFTKLKMDLRAWIYNLPQKVKYYSRQKFGNLKKDEMLSGGWSSVSF